MQKHNIEAYSNGWVIQAENEDYCSDRCRSTTVAYSNARGIQAENEDYCSDRCKGTT